jgi:hypothetical protein
MGVGRCVQSVGTYLIAITGWCGEARENTLLDYVCEFAELSRRALVLNEVDVDERHYGGLFLRVNRVGCRVGQGIHMFYDFYAIMTPFSKFTS